MRGHPVWFIALEQKISHNYTENSLLSWSLVLKTAITYTHVKMGNFMETFCCQLASLNYSSSNKFLLYILFPHADNGCNCFLRVLGSWAKSHDFPISDIKLR